LPWKKAAQLVPEGDFIQCDIDRMPFRRETFDVVLSLGVLHHIPHWQVNLRKLVGLLRPGGWMLFDEAIVLCTPNPHTKKANSRCSVVPERKIGGGRYGPSLFL